MNFYRLVSNARLPNCHSIGLGHKVLRIAKIKSTQGWVSAFREGNNLERCDLSLERNNRVEGLKKKRRTFNFAEGLGRSVVYYSSTHYFHIMQARPRYEVVFSCGGRT